MQVFVSSKHGEALSKAQANFCQLQSQILKQFSPNPSAHYCCSKKHQNHFWGWLHPFSKLAICMTRPFAANGVESLQIMLPLFFSVSILAAGFLDGILPILFTLALSDLSIATHCKSINHWEHFDKNHLHSKDASTFQNFLLFPPIILSHQCSASIWLFTNCIISPPCNPSLIFWNPQQPMLLWSTSCSEMF